MRANRVQGTTVMWLSAIAAVGFAPSFGRGSAAIAIPDTSVSAGTGAVVSNPTWNRDFLALILLLSQYYQCSAKPDSSTTIDKAAIELAKCLTGSGPTGLTKGDSAENTKANIRSLYYMTLDAPPELSETSRHNLLSALQVAYEKLGGDPGDLL
ncbi:MAG: hypothetical protein KF745_00885 [Phycisphaeraceae bacterium]|nr:hypothetical protein [Phycisphaeraceae bacterium]